MPDAPWVIGLMGLPGSGKSQLAQAMSASLGWSVLDRDRIRQGLRLPDEPLDKAKQRAAQAMRQQLLGHLGHQQSVILDGMTLATTKQRECWADLARQAGGHWQLVFLDCPIQLAVKRVSADPAHPAEDRDADLVHRVANHLQHPDAALALDARQPTEKLLAQLRRQLSLD